MASQPIIYGIKNCDTMKKARTWLDEHGVAYAFHDYKASGIDGAHLEAWIKAVGWKTVLNRAGTTFRKLPEAERENLTEAKAIKLMLEQPSMIKRPILETGKGLPLVGFKPEAYAVRFGYAAAKPMLNELLSSGTARTETLVPVRGVARRRRIMPIR